ncbi:hypothetical protein ACTXNW_17290 [Enterococcus malodoratus]
MMKYLYERSETSSNDSLYDLYAPDDHRTAIGGNLKLNMVNKS